jgi:hypothetical protein
MPTLYDEDVALWAEQQGRLLREAARRGNNGPIDWDNVAEEIESLGNVQAHEIRRRLARIVEHLLKLQFSPAREPRRGWLETILQQRAEIESVLEDSPSLRRRLPEMLEWVAPRTAKRTATSLELWGEIEASEAVRQHDGHYTLAQVLEDNPPGL